MALGRVQSTCRHSDLNSSCANLSLTHDCYEKLSSLHLYLVISQLLLEQSSFLAVTGSLLHGSSDVLQSLLCLDLYTKQNTYLIVHNSKIADAPSCQISTHVAAEFQLSAISIPSGVRRLHNHPIRPHMTTACLLSWSPVWYDMGGRIPD